MAGGAVLPERAPGEAWPHDLGSRAGERDPAVGIDDTLAGHENRQEGLVRDAGNQRQRADEEGDDVEQVDGERARGPGERDAAEEQGATDIFGDHDRSTFPPIDDGTALQPDQERWQRAHSREHSHLRGGRVERHDRGQRRRETGNPGADLRDGLARPELREDRMPPQTRFVRHGRDRAPCAATGSTPAVVPRMQPPGRM